MNTTGEQESSMFSEQWGIYKSVIEHNYMYHAELIEIVNETISSFETPSILDLGCGDSYVVSESLSDDQAIDYWGIDSAAMALDFGKINLERAKGKITLINEDLLIALESMNRSFDVIISGYSLHHLEAKDKKKCFDLISKLLSDNGVFIFYDLENNSDEEASDYIERVCNIFTAEWVEFDEKTLGDIRQHIEDNDIPENEAFYLENFKRVGFSDVNKIFRDEDKAFAAYVLRKA